MYYSKNKAPEIYPSEDNSWQIRKKVYFPKETITVILNMEMHLKSGSMSYVKSENA